MSLNGLHETRRTWIRMLMYPFMHGTWIKAKSNSCSVDMSHRGKTPLRVWIILWPLWMSATDRLSMPSLTTSKCLIKLKWFKNDDDKYLWMAVLHGPVACRRLTTSQLAKISSNTPSASFCPPLVWFPYQARNRKIQHLTWMDENYFSLTPCQPTGLWWRG